MSTVVTLTANRPPARADARPWTQAQLQEAAAPDGEWTTIETFELDVDGVDPEAPETHSFTSELATLEAGWYRVVWVDEDGDTTPAQPQLAGPPWSPSLEDVSRAMLSRVRDQFGNVLSTFTADTTPTSAEVAKFIVDSADFLSARVDLDVSNARRRLARRVCALRAAVLAERAVARGKETQRGKDLKTTFDEELAALLDAPDATPVRYRRGSIATPTIYTAS